MGLIAGSISFVGRSGHGDGLGQGGAGRRGRPTRPGAGDGRRHAGGDLRCAGVGPDHRAGSSGGAGSTVRRAPSRRPGCRRRRARRHRMPSRSRTSCAPSCSSSSPWPSGERLNVWARARRPGAARVPDRHAGRRRHHQRGGRRGRRPRVRAHRAQRRDRAAGVPGHQPDEPEAVDHRRRGAAATHQRRGAGCRHLRRRAAGAVSTPGPGLRRRGGGGRVPRLRAELDAGGDGDDGADHVALRASPTCLPAHHARRLVLRRLGERADRPRRS